MEGQFGSLLKYWSKHKLLEWQYNCYPNMRNRLFQQAANTCGGNFMTPFEWR